LLMSYQVLARKWRPGNFDELVGQAHVLRALSSALDNERLHHAYLFTGTRGVGKTTIARILARCLNCEEGISSKPCGVCSSCNEINEGRFVDLIEVDAASRTKVEDTRELLENVQYRPTRGRYKVYLIDEVHMLSNHSFNALLKTLEEPPPHVVFLLATTDPQKLPATVLSRCLQFHLKNMQPDDISNHLTYILKEEAIESEQGALESIAWSAKGSMRDALSLLDQAIAFGDGKVTDKDVREMLGTIDRDHVYRLVSALSNNDGASCMSIIDELSQFAPDYDDVLAELLAVLHRIALIQQIPDASLATLDKHSIEQLAGAISAEDVQLFYQLALHGRRDLPLAPDKRSGFEMCILRLMSFRPAAVGVAPGKKPESSSQSVLVKTNDASHKEDSAIKTAVIETNKVEAKLEETKSSEAKLANNKPEYIKLEQTKLLEPEQADNKSEDIKSEDIKSEEANPVEVIPQINTAMTEEISIESISEGEGYPIDIPDYAYSEVEHEEQHFDDPRDQSATKQTESTDTIEPSKPSYMSSPLKSPLSRSRQQASVTQPKVQTETVIEQKTEHILATNTQRVAEKVTERPEERVVEKVTENIPKQVLDKAAEGTTKIEAEDQSVADLDVYFDTNETTLELPEVLTICQENWHCVIAKSTLTGVTEQIALNSQFISFDGEVFKLSLANNIRTMVTNEHINKLTASVNGIYNSSYRVILSELEPEFETPKQRKERIKQQRHKAACDNLYNDPQLQGLLNTFGAQLDQESVETLLH
jgi:DNA polymerase-3 subunit gamma/tau